MTDVASGGRVGAQSTSLGGAAFTRKSSGLIKTGTPFRIFLFVFTSIGLGVYTSLFYYIGAGAFPGSYLLLGIALTGVAMLALTGIYAIMSGTFPRSGGEYLYISRILSPVAGFAANFGIFLAWGFFAGTTGYLIFTLGLSPLLVTWGVVTHTHGLVSAGQWMGTNGHAWLLGSVLVVVSGLIAALGMKAYYRYQAITFAVGFGSLVVMLLVLLVSSRAHFMSGFNHFMLGVGSHDTYNTILAKARAASIPTSHTLYDTLGVFTIATAVASTGYVGGEVRTPGRTQAIGMFGGIGCIYVLLIVMGLIMYKTVGVDFNRSASFLAYQDPTKWSATVSPVIPFYAFVCTTSPVLLFIMAVGLVLFTLIIIPQAIIFSTRMLFAWSFDRLVPDKVADVEPRSHSPLIATAIATLTTLGMLALYGGKQLTYVNPILILCVTYMVLSVAAIAFPYRKGLRETYRHSPGANLKVLGVPVLVICGVVSFLFWASALYTSLTSDTLGANTTSNIRVAVLAFVVPFVYYFAVKYYRSRQGIDLRATFAELPPA